MPAADRLAHVGSLHHPVGDDDRARPQAVDALDALVEEHALETAVRVGVDSAEGPPEIVDRADVVVDGVDGFAQVLAILADA